MSGAGYRPRQDGERGESVRPALHRRDAVFKVLVALIAVELLKVLFAPNPLDVIVLAGLIGVLIFSSR